ncbi:CRISPR-associated endoribonuclease Cas6 [Streptomyces johnsoniae]|uniref:CRISPR-associated endoribonuclease Cas6 n=1 Tax=Streptomyces johnsoniae TaxID=3075532 RepID=A0ABU2SD09_9ACTN|nr:CRISPR-associated endoribonuclease Cas6 [Streptomyces sp. DSM 41886]MDT0446833.1 CRISPR-associated endoribonuclease Cas6 [Streptomyces sp. DSM 41886]
MDVDVNVPSLPWDDVHGPARAVVYGLIGSQDAELARSLHDEGWKGHRLRPLGLTSPQFRGAPRKSGVYTTSRNGSLWFGSPVPEIAAALVAGLAGQAEIIWGTARLKVRGFALDFDVPSDAGVAEFATATPVILKDERRYLLPGDEGYIERLQHNLEHKADVLGLPRPRHLRLLEAGPRRRFTVRGAPRIGARLRVGMDADARFAQALRSWGLGLDTVQGFGWVR